MLAAPQVERTVLEQDESVPARLHGRPPRRADDVAASARARPRVRLGRLGAPRAQPQLRHIKLDRLRSIGHTLHDESLQARPP